MSWELGLILFFLMTALLFYILFGGADFGAGILELFLGRERRMEQQKLISHAMAPVWEANHVWLILALVICFVAFPTIYTELSTYLHLPLLAIIMGIVARGCAFTFRYYDTLTTAYQRVYSIFFSSSSLWTSFFLGVFAGAAVQGVRSTQGDTFYALYVAPWFNFFSLCTGLLFCSLFALLAAVYLVRESRNKSLNVLFVGKAKRAGFVFIGSGLLLLVAYMTSPFSLPQPWYERFLESAAPASTLRSLAGALVVGAAIIFPSLAYLLIVFKRETFERKKSAETKGSLPL